MRKNQMRDDGGGHSGRETTLGRLQQHFRLPSTAEAMVAWNTAELRVRLNCSKFILEGDSLEVVNAFHIQKITVDTSLKRSHIKKVCYVKEMANEKCLYFGKINIRLQRGISMWSLDLFTCKAAILQDYKLLRFKSRWSIKFRKGDFRRCNVQPI